MIYLSYYVLENHELKVKIANKGAELRSIKSKVDGTEYLWQADVVFGDVIRQFYSRLLVS